MEPPPDCMTFAAPATVANAVRALAFMTASNSSSRVKCAGFKSSEPAQQMTASRRPKTLAALADASTMLS